MEVWHRGVSRYQGRTLKMRLIMSSWSWKAGLAGTAIVAATAYAVAQMPNHSGMHGQMGMGNSDQQQMIPQGGMHGEMHEQMIRGQNGMQGGMWQHGMMMSQGGMRGEMHERMMQGQHGMQGGMGQRGMMMGSQIPGQPTMAGQDAFGTIQEVVRILEADPATDWSKVNISALRDHLIDMNEVALRAVATERALDNGVEIAVTGEGRTLEAIKHMIPAHADELKKIGWTANTEELPNGVKLVVTTPDPKQAIKLKALGFMGLMVQGGHHQLHHLMMAQGELHVH